MADLIQETLEALEETGGDDAFINIKCVLRPWILSCWLVLRPARVLRLRGFVLLLGFRFFSMPCVLTPFCRRYMIPTYESCLYS